MFNKRRRSFLYAACVAFSFHTELANALEIQSGVGVGVEHTNNATLSADDKMSDNIAIAYVGANITEDEGTLTHNTQLSFNRYNYLQDTFDDTRYFNLAVNADWEMIKDRFHWILSDTFDQRMLDSFDANTPDNLQDTNVFSLGANVIFPFSARSKLTLIPNYSQYYFELQNTNNNQYSLTGSWDYKMTRRNSVGLNLSTRNIDYTQESILGETVEDTRFTTLSINVSGKQPRSLYSIDLGSTRVKREGGDETSGFSGGFDWLTNLTSRSTFSAIASTELTDTSSATLNIDVGLPQGRAPVTTDVIRNSIFSLLYAREDELLRSSVGAEYRKVKYSESPLDQVDKTLNATVGYPLTRKLTCEAYANYIYSKRLETVRVDKRTVVGGNIKYKFSRKLNGSFDLAYRDNNSTIDVESYEEFTAYVSLVYGFGEVYRPTRVASGF